MGRPVHARMSFGIAVILSTILIVGSPSGCTPRMLPRQAGTPRVTVQLPEQREIVDYSEYNGWTEASQTVEIRARVRGHIDKVDFVDGQIVKQGDLLFELDPRPFQAEIDVAKAQEEVAKAQLEFAAAEEEREQGLFEKKVNTKADLQRAVASRKTWEANVLAAKEDVIRKSLDLEYAKITAPITGKISRALLTPGNLVNAGGSDPMLTTIVAFNPLYVYFFVDERALLTYRSQHEDAVEKGLARSLKDSKISFEFGLETDEGYPNKGILDFAENRIDSKTGTVELRGAVDNADAKFYPGSRVRVRIPVTDPYPAMLVPDVAVLSDQDRRYVLCLNKENVVYRKDLRLGRLLEDGMRVVLPATAGTENLSPQDVVIVEGLQRARINYPVEPMDSTGQPFVPAAASAVDARVRR